ncbi:MAG: tRNA 2-thiocytidine biosynthesis protein TtcA [Selenomonadaceae bacterium]|nr:tRNA 2-thiocytidine biosynthesis protein TtcA [Selenomonadaceae bacterium]
MKINLPQSYFSKLMRAVVEFRMIENEDKILVGLSGGKDSLFLLYAMAVLKARLRKKFSFGAITIDPMFTADFPMETLAGYCASLNIPFADRQVDIAGAIRAQGDKKACFTCAYFRRGAINRYATENGFNKIAYAHHHDDAVETFFMSLMYSGQLTTFTPVTYLDRTNLTVIRPLVYFREEETRAAVAFHGFTPVASPCPRDGQTFRARTKEIIRALGEDNPKLYAHLSAAMREGALGELWPRSKTRDEMRETYYAYMGTT